MPAGKPEAELDVTEALARRLLDTQHPDLAELPLSLLDSGWDNVMFRLGAELTLRLPRREIAAQLLVNEQTWLPRLAPSLPLPISAPLRTGAPTEFYPWHWSVLPWFDGECADVQPPAEQEAERFADFLAALHQPAPENAPTNPVRGVPLTDREANTRERLGRVRSDEMLITPEILGLWESALDAPLASDARWLHGDLHAQNVLTNGSGELAAVIDWGDITSGDVATDLAGIWTLFEAPGARARVLERYGCDDQTRLRAMGWAATFGIVLLDSGRINSPRHATAGTRILRRLQADIR